MKKIIGAIVILAGAASLVYGVLDLYYWGIEDLSVGCIVLGAGCIVGAVLAVFRQPTQAQTESRARYEEMQAERMTERERVRAENENYVTGLKERARESGVACCPHCGCTTIFPYRKPWNWWLFGIGFIFLWGIGGLLGLIGRGGFSKCAKCGYVWNPQKESVQVPMRAAPRPQPVEKSERKIKPINFPDRVDDLPMAYSYWVEFLPYSGVDIDSILGGSEKLIDVAAEDGTIILSYQKTVFGKIVNRSRAEMVSDFVRRGEPVCGVLRADGQHVNLLFYKDKRKGSEWRDQDVVKLAKFKGEEAQSGIWALQEGDPLDFEQADADIGDEDDVAEVFICSKGTIIGKLPKKYAEKFAESEAYGVFYEKTEEVEANSGDVFSVPYVRIYW